jgi:hypothetical protein
MTRTDRMLTFTAAGMLVLGLGLRIGAAHAGSRYDRWNNSGYALDHHFYTTRWNEWIDGSRGGSFGSRDRQSPNGPSDTEVSLAIAGQRACRPLIMYTDTGRIVQPADGCRK